MDRMYRILVIYDISDNRQRRNYVKILNRFGSRVQYSAFEAILSDRKYKKLVNCIGKVHNNDDSVRIYKMCIDTDVSCFGYNNELSYDFNEDIIM